MKRFKLIILVFSIAVAVPLAFLTVRTYRSLAQEEVAQLRYFAETLFDEMENELARLIEREESRAVDEFNYFVPFERDAEAKDRERSPLSIPPSEDYILGYLQNNPDGSFQTPITEPNGSASKEADDTMTRLAGFNEIFNLKRAQPREPSPAQIQTKSNQEEQRVASGFADRYLNLSQARQQKTHLGQEAKRLEKIPASQALNLSRSGQNKARIEEAVPFETKKEDIGPFPADAPAGEGYDWAGDVDVEAREPAEPVFRPSTTSPQDSKTLQVEVDPMQSVGIDEGHIFIFRRIVINNQIYRQGFIINVRNFLAHLIDRHFAKQPMARFTNLNLRVSEPGLEATVEQAGASSVHPKFKLNRDFPRPFSFLHASLTCQDIPRAPGRRTLNIMLIALVSVILLGLLAIYHSFRVVVELSERRSQFVSSVTHELKTPLTNIRMYIEMLEQGIARDQEREQDYFRILGSESARLSRLINNVLEFSKLEMKQRHFDLRQGSFDEVVQEVIDVMREKMRQEGFILHLEKTAHEPFKYDREVMVQVLINLIENSIKFGRDSKVREITLTIGSEGPWVKISVSDTGPGIERFALKKVFEDFYRVDNSRTRTTTGTGIGLALVKKLINAMGGQVSAKNNDGPGCTITITLPA